MRKAQMSWSVDIILLFAGAVVLMIAAGYYYGYFGNQAKEEICKDSVAAQANSKLLPSPGGMKSLVYIDCAKRYVDIYPDNAKFGYTPEDMEPLEVSVHGKKITKYQLSPDIVYQIFAEEMKTCYYEFGEAKLNAFDNTAWKDNNVCFLCSEINFKKMTKQETYGDLLNYLNKTLMPKDRMTYYEYFDQPSLSKVKWSTFVNSINNGGVLWIKTTESYSIVFTKQDERLKTSLKTGLCFGPQYLICKALGIKTIDPKQPFNVDVNNNYYVYAVPSSDLNSFCDVQAI